VLLEYVRGLSFKICNPLFKFDERNNPSLNVDKTCKGCGLSSIQSTGQNRVYGPHANIEKISHRRVFWQSKIHTDRPVVFSSADLTKGPGPAAARQGSPFLSFALQLIFGILFLSP
jgi:predicted GTPase